MKKIVFMLFALTFSATSYAASIKAEVNGMVCAFCAKGIEKKLKALPEAQNVFVDLKKHIVVLELKPNQEVPLDDFKAIIKDAGYDVSKAEVVDKTAAEIKAEAAQ
ncbi:MAG TPA: heavy metal-associated domain-containing protein [Methylophilaceae bacterium]|nr:heavy metal-associated domain-containing protein [Methylophilaceae bacterium]